MPVSRMFEVFHTDRPDGPSTLSDFFLTRDEAEARVASSTGGRWDSELGRSVPMVGSDFLSIREVERESRPCKFCGQQVQSDTADFCRGCYYQGRIFEDGVKGIIEALKAHPMIDAETVGVWHTGGGCFCVGATYRWDAATEVEILTSREASVDEPPSAEAPWGMCLTQYGERGDSYLNGEDTITSTADVVAEVDRLVALWENGRRD